MSYLAERAERELSNWWNEDICRDMIRRAYETEHANDGYQASEIVASEMAAAGMPNQAVNLMDLLDRGDEE